MRPFTILSYHYYLQAFSFVLIVILHSFAYSQPPSIVWERNYGGAAQDEGYSVQQTSDGGFIIGGWTWSFGLVFRDFYLQFLD